MDVKKKILFIVSNMNGGGAQRVISIILNYLDRTKFDPILVLLKKEGPYLKDLPEDIQVIDLHTKARYAMIKIIKTIKQIKPDLVFSTLSYLNALIIIIRPFLSKNIIFIARETNTISITNKRQKYPMFFNLVYKVFYNNFNQIVSQSKYMKKDLIDNFNIIEDKVEVIYNPVDITKIKNFTNKNAGKLYKSDRFNLLAVAD